MCRSELIIQGSRPFQFPLECEQLDPNIVTCRLQAVAVAVVPWPSPRLTLSWFPPPALGYPPWSFRAICPSNKIAAMMNDFQFIQSAMEQIFHLNIRKISF